MYSAPFLRPVFIIGVLNLCHGRGDKVVKAGFLSSFINSSLASYISLYSFIFERTIEGSYGIRETGARSGRNPGVEN
jgi:hypothetical protein